MANTTTTNFTNDDDDIPSTTTTIVHATQNHTHTIIFLHGREDYGSDLAQYFFDTKSHNGLSLAEIFPSVKWVFPTATLRYCAKRDEEFSASSFAETLKGEEIISQWFDVWDLGTPYERQELIVDGLRESTQQIIEIIREEEAIVSREKIILGGISQGNATAIMTLLSSGLNFAGYIGLSSWLPFQNVITAFPEGVKKNQAALAREVGLLFQDEKDTTGMESLCAKLGNLSATATADDTTDSITLTNTTPIFLSHSRDDETVPFEQGEGLRETIASLGFNVTAKVYEDGGHWIHPRHGVDDIAGFLQGVISP